MMSSQIKLELLKHKEEHARSAIASQEVREHLAGFIRSKRQFGCGSSSQLNNITPRSLENIGKQLSANTSIRNPSSKASSRFASSSLANNRRSHSQLASSNLANGSSELKSRPAGLDESNKAGSPGPSAGQEQAPTETSDDHPLRKTASMPTIPSPYKSRTRSRKRLVERRTTMSPLMKQKTRATGKHLDSLDSSDLQDYSSNPCIVQDATIASVHHPKLGQRSLSQSDSPTANIPITASSSMINQATKLGSTSGGGGGGGSTLRGSGGGGASRNQYSRQHSSASKTSKSQTNLPTTTAASSRKWMDFEQLQKQQQHQRVQEAIRKTVVNRSTSRARMAVVGGSLDSSEIATVAALARAAGAPDPTTATAAATASTATDHQSAAAAAPTSKASPELSASSSTNNVNNGRALFSTNRDDMRQWSLDAADLRSLGSGGGSNSSAPASQLRPDRYSAVNAALLAAQLQANQQLTWGMFNAEFHRLRLATAKEISSLKRSQSPQASISLNMNSQSNQSVRARPQQQQQHCCNTKPSAQGPRNLSSCPSSSSNLVPGQASLEDPTTQAIDLSSSSETSRQRILLEQRQEQKQLQSARLNYQKILQESFNQLQLQSSTNDVSQSALYDPSGSQATETKREANETAHMTCTSNTTTTEIAPSAQHHPTTNDAQFAQNNNIPLATLASIAEQFNLSDSAHDLVSMHTSTGDPMDRQQQLEQLNGLIAEHQRRTSAAVAASAAAADLNPWAAVYTNLVQSAEFQQSTQITSSLWTKMTSLPEPYPSALLAQWIHLHQSQHRQLCSDQAPGNGESMPTNQESANRPAAPPKSPAPIHSLASEQHRPSMGRALSSPLLMSASFSLASSESSKQQPPSKPAAAAPSANTTQQNEDSSNNNATRDQDEISEGSDMIVDVEETCSEAKREQENGQQQSEQVSLDLSLSNLNKLSLASTQQASSVSENISEQKDVDNEIEKMPELKSPSRSRDRLCDVNFSFLPKDLDQASCNFIYNPIFDPDASTGLVYDLELCNHKCTCQDDSVHPENSSRVLAIWRRLHDIGLMKLCARIDGRRATLNELQLCHSETYSNYFGKTPYERIKLKQLDLSKLPIEGLTALDCGGRGADVDTAWNEEQTPAVARLAVGCAIEAAIAVASGRMLNAFAVIRPPGHHAEFQQAMGFCFFNNLSVACRVLQLRHHVRRILILDWDVHHGNGIQKSFYEDKNIMYVSLHRHDKGNFFPGTGDIHEIGYGEGVGYNWNIAWSNATMGDAEYLAAFRSIIMPIARDFNPSMVLVAAGFDGARGHSFNFGGYDLSPACYAYMTRQLMTLANGRVICCLEGGYELEAISDCAESVVRTLLGETGGRKPVRVVPQPMDRLDRSELERVPNPSAIEILENVSKLAAKFWVAVGDWRPTIRMSALAAQRLMNATDV